MENGRMSCNILPFVILNGVNQLPFSIRRVILIFIRRGFQPRQPYIPSLGEASVPRQPLLRGKMPRLWVGEVCQNFYNALQ